MNLAFYLCVFLVLREATAKDGDCFLHVQQLWQNAQSSIVLCQNEEVAILTETSTAVIDPVD